MDRRRVGTGIVLAVALSLVAATATAQGRGPALETDVAAAVARGDGVIPWDGEGAVPPGYEATSRGNRPLIWVGVGAGALGWVSVAGYALGHSMGCATWGGRDCDVGYLLIPIAGPWLAIGTQKTGGLPPGMLAVTGVLQAGGLALAILGATQRQPLLRRRRDLVVVPVVAPGFQGVGAQTSF